MNKGKSISDYLANQETLPLMERLLAKFPTTEMESRAVKDSDWKDSLFILKREGNTTYVTIPKNLESFADNLFMIALLKHMINRRWILQVSTKELPTSVFETSEAAYFAGFVAQSCLETTGECIKGISKFSKGARAFQTFSIEKKYGKQSYLRTGGMDSLLKRLSVMAGFTKDYWGLRGTIAAIWREATPCRVTNLETYLRPKQEILKVIKTKLAYENGGLFRPEEIAYLDEKYADTKQAITQFVNRLDKPSEDLATNFDKEYAKVKTLVDQCDNAMKTIGASRAKTLFPQGKKKKDINYRKKQLAEKITDIESDEILISFLPEALPGINRVGTIDNQNINNPQVRSRLYLGSYQG
jgi:hypothetical protein